MSNTATEARRGNAPRTIITSERPPLAALRSDKITDEHLTRLAIVYVRQSTPQQVLEHRESTARQYALVDRAVALGWPSAAVQVIDEDQGQSGSSAAGRNGFQRLLSEISSDRVGLILDGRLVEVASRDAFFHHPVDPRTRAFSEGRIVY